MPRKKSYRRKTYRKSRTTYGRVFRTRRGRLGQYKYVNGRKVGFKPKYRRR